MIKTQLLKYIKASIEDEYAMEVLYYSIKSAALKNGLAFETATSIVVDGRFLGETIQIGFNNRFQSQIKTVALLLMEDSLVKQFRLILIIDSKPRLRLSHCCYQSELGCLIRDI